MSKLNSSQPFSKYDAGKPRFSLVPVAALESAIAVLEMGAVKYAPDNWRECKDATRYLDAAMRHMLAIYKGEYVDIESGLPHAAHVAVNMMFVEELTRCKGQTK